MIKMKRKLGRIKKILSVFIYLIHIVCLFYPWIIVGSERYNFLRLGRVLKEKGIEVLIRQGNVITDNPGFLGFGVQMTVWMLSVYLFLCVGYIVLVLAGRGRRFPVVMFCFWVVFIFSMMGQGGIGELCMNSFQTVLIPSVLFLLTIFEIMAGKSIEVIQEEKEQRLKKEESLSIKNEDCRKENREEKKRGFKGKYNTAFYKIIWKNFKSNRRDYLVFVLCSSLIFAVLLLGFGMRKLMKSGDYMADMMLTDSAGQILIQGMIFLGSVSVLIMILLIFYYLKCRAKNYGIFLTLGMRKKTLYYFVGIEYGAGFIVSLFVGSILGNAGLRLVLGLVKRWTETPLTLSDAGALVYLQTVFMILGIYIVSLALARDIFVDFHMGKNADLRELREKMPRKFLGVFLVVGTVIAFLQIVRYSQIYNFERFLILEVFFVGVFIIVRYGMTLGLKGKKKSGTYFQKVLKYNQFNHKSRTSTLYLTAIAVFQICILFYFAVPVITVMLEEKQVNLYPYDYVCMANEEDEVFFDRLEMAYGLEMYRYPMVRVSNYDSTEQMEGQGQDTVQGQQIGISETTYHALKSYADIDYQKSSLNLGNKRHQIHIVHQQGKGMKAQPADFWLWGKKPLLHIGQPCVFISRTDALLANRGDMGYYFMDVVSEEIESLTGCFGQGVKENLIVFSDQEFQRVKELWKVTDIYTGKKIEKEEDRIPGVTIRQGPSKLVLFNVKEKDMVSVLEEMERFKEHHAYDEQYDYSVKSFYTKKDAVQEMKKERTMKQTMNGLLVFIFFLASILLFYIKLLTEFEEKQKRAEFLRCIGMVKKERILLIWKETFVYVYLPAMLALASAAGFTAAVFRARMYTREDIETCLKYLSGFWVVSLSVWSLVTGIMVYLYTKAVERSAYERIH